MESLDWLIEKGVPIVAHAGWQENSAKPCDTGSPIPEIAAEFPKIDFSHVDPIYPDKTSAKAGLYEYTKKGLLNRAQFVLEDLYKRPERGIVVVSHSGFMRQCLTGDFYFNADYRIYDFEERKSGDAPLKLKQWDLTREGPNDMGGGLGWSSRDLVEPGIGLPAVPGEDAVLPAGVREN